MACLCCSPCFIPVSGSKMHPRCTTPFSLASGEWGNGFVIKMMIRLHKFYCGTRYALASAIHVTLL